MIGNGWRWYMAIVLGASIFLAGCGGSGVSDASKSGSKSAPATTATSAPASSSAKTTSACPNGSLQGCYSFGQMSAFLTQARGLIAPFFATEYGKLPAPRSVVFVASNQIGSSPCGGSVDSEAYEFCSANDSIYIGQDMLWSFYHDFGDAAPVVALAHEWGHHVQAYMRVPQPRTAAQSVTYEDQADCISGAWTQYAGQQGILEYPDDLNNVDALIKAIGSRETASRDHGTSTERRKSFDLGYNGGLAACNAFYPGNPVYQPGV